MEAFNECLINTISVLLQPGEMSSLRKATRTCREFRSLLTPISGDTRLGAQRQRGLWAGGAQPRPGGALPQERPQCLFPAPEVSLFLPIWHAHVIFDLTVLPLPQGGSSDAPQHVSAAWPCPVPSRGAAGGYTLWQEGTGCPTGFISCPIGQLIFPPVATWDAKLIPL